MATYADRLTKTAGDALDGETFIAAIKCMLEGDAKRKAVAAGFFGVIGHLAVTSETQESKADRPEPWPKELALGITATRLFVFPMGKMSGRASATPGAIVPIGRVRSLGSEMKRTFGTKQLVLRITFDDRSCACVETFRGHVPEGELLAQELRERMASG